MTIEEKRDVCICNEATIEEKRDVCISNEVTSEENAMCASLSAFAGDDGLGYTALFGPQ